MIPSLVFPTVLCSKRNQRGQVTFSRLHSPLLIESVLEAVSIGSGPSDFPFFNLFPVFVSLFCFVLMRQQKPKEVRRLYKVTNHIS